MLAYAWASDLEKAPSDTPRPFWGAADYAGVTTGEEGIKKGSLGACAHRQQRCNERWQWQLAVSSKGIWKTAMHWPAGEMHPSKSDQTNSAEIAVKIHGTEAGIIKHHINQQVTICFIAMNRLSLVHWVDRW